MWGRVGRSVRDESGVALLTVLGVMLIVTLLAVGSFTLASQALHESVRIENETEAFRAASAGLETVLSTFSEAEAQAMIGGVAVSGSTPDGSYTVTVEDLGDNQWRLTSIGMESNGATETVRQEFYFIDLWKMNFSGGSQSLMSGSSGLNGQSSIVGPFYMKGDLNVQANMAILEGPLFVKGGDIIPKNPNLWIGMIDMPIKVYCDGAIPENEGDGSGKGAGIYIGSRVRSVPDITIPELTQEQLEEWATTAKNESVDNLMGTTDLINLESTGGVASTYTTMMPPNTLTWSRAKKASGTMPYKFVGPTSGEISAKGEGATPLTIGGTGSFGAWGSTTTTDGVSVSGPGPTGVSSYPANRYDDFAYDDVNNILYVWGTVFVDGPLTLNEDMTYIGNGTIIVNGPIQVNGNFRPYGTNQQGENNKWAVGLVTPLDIHFARGGNNPTGSTDRDALRDVLPNYAGAFYTERKAWFDGTNILVRGTVLSGQMQFASPNNCLITNPLLPSYLPESLPGLGMGILTPGLWSRG